MKPDPKSAAVRSGYTAGVEKTSAKPIRERSLKIFALLVLGVPAVLSVIPFYDCTACGSPIVPPPPGPCRWCKDTRRWNFWEGWVKSASYVQWASDQPPPDRK